MLILSRRATERIYLGDEIVLTIVAVGTDKVRIGVKAPSGVRILRDELELQTSSEPTIELSTTELSSDVKSDFADTLPFPKIAEHSLKLTGDVLPAPASKQLQPEPSGLRSFIQTRRAA